MWAAVRQRTPAEALQGAAGAPGPQVRDAAQEFERVALLLQRVGGGVALADDLQQEGLVQGQAAARG
jgi:hypothetical protein